MRDPVANQARVEALDRASFWVFMVGLYHYKYLLYTFIALVFEKQCLNWLTNRNGCTYFNFQKFIELDIRRDSLRYNWLNPRYCSYDVENYRKHYFANDFDQVKQRILDNISENPDILKDEYGRDKQGDFIPGRVAKRLRQTITFSVKLDLRSPEIKFGAATEEKLKETHDKGYDFFSSNEYDYEEVPVLRDHKVQCLEEIIKGNVNRKYKISFAKGIQMLLESLIMLLLMVSIAVKGNIYALIYLVFIFKFVVTRSKTKLLVRINIYMSVMFFVQYLLYTLNLTASTSPAPFPPGLVNYPRNADPKDGSVKYALPWFLQYSSFKDLRIAYLLGLGVDRDQLKDLMIDFVNMFIVTMYILTFRNPILQKTMVKVFWQFPTPANLEQWKRLAPQVQEYVRWLHNPDDQRLTNQPVYQKETSNFPDTTLTRRQVQSSSMLEEFAKEYNERNKVDLNEVLTTWVDLKYEEIWSHEFLKKKKQEIKDNNTYFRMVKQGSQLVYVCFHIFTILVVMLSATMRQSVLSLGYVLILLPFVKDGADVLKQRNIHQNECRDKLESQVESMQRELREGAGTRSGSERAQLEERLREARAKLMAANQRRKRSGLSFKQKREEQKNANQKDWGMIKVVKIYLLIYGILDYTVQIIGQLPIFEVHGNLEALGFRKIWSWDPATHSAEMVFSYAHFVSRIN